jgi:hypothetical protein
VLKFFSQLLNACRVSDVRHTAEPLVLECIPFEGKIAVAWLKKCKCQVWMKFQKKWFKYEVKQYILKSTNSLILRGIRKKLPE